MKMSSCIISHFFSILFSILSMAVAWDCCFGLDFDNQDLEAPSESDNDQSRPQLSDLDVESDQCELRVLNPHAFGVVVGEAIPGLSYGLAYSETMSDLFALNFSAGIGRSRTTEQVDGADSFINRARVTMIHSALTWWPTRNFPFAFDTGVSMGSITGKISSSGQSSKSYQSSIVGIQEGLTMNTFFENRIWLKWVLISGEYFQIFQGSFKELSGPQKKTIKHQENGFKISGISNLTIGYAW